MCEPAWGIACHSCTSSTRRWYHVARLVEADGQWWELYWHHDIGLRGNSRDKIRAAAKASGLELLEGYFEDKPSPRIGFGMTWHREHGRRDKSPR